MFKKGIFTFSNIKCHIHIFKVGFADLTSFHSKCFIPSCWMAVFLASFQTNILSMQCNKNTKIASSETNILSIRCSKNTKIQNCQLLKQHPPLQPYACFRWKVKDQRRKNSQAFGGKKNTPTYKTFHSCQHSKIWTTILWCKEIRWKQEAPV